MKKQTCDFTGIVRGCMAGKHTDHGTLGTLILEVEPPGQTIPRHVWFGDLGRLKRPDGLVIPRGLFIQGEWSFLQSIERLLMDSPVRVLFEYTDKGKPIPCLVPIDKDGGTIEVEGQTVFHLGPGGIPVS